MKTIPKSKREAFIIKLESQKEYKHKVGEKIIVLLDQLDDLDKASIIGRLFKCAILEEISYEDFLRLSSIVHRAFLPDVNKLNQPYDLGKETEEHFANLGIMTMKLEETKVSSNGSLSKIQGPFIFIRYELNSLGKKLKKYGFEDEITAS